MRMFSLATLCCIRPSDSIVPTWRALPHVERRDVLAGGVCTMASTFTGNGAGLVSASTYVSTSSPSPRSVASIESHPVIPVWPTWGGGRVVPVSLDGPLQDPFLLLAHHRHWFDPRDPLREPFKMAGKALGLPYVDVEGFSMHPHRGFDILTYVLDGSDGFRHRDSLSSRARTYRGGTAQWMRTGSGVLHEEFWETRPDRRTDVELFQLWVNLPSFMKFDRPCVRYIGEGTEDSWVARGYWSTESKDGENNPQPTAVRDIGATLDIATAKASRGVQEEDDWAARPRPPLGIVHAKIGPGEQWDAPAPRDHTAVLYVRDGKATLPGSGRGGLERIAGSLQTATFAPDGDSIKIVNAAAGRWELGSGFLDVLLLTGAPLREPVSQGGPIVMNTREELNDAFRQLSDGTFLDREVSLSRQREQLQHSGGQTI